MPLFVCDRCHGMENTALGHFWSRNMRDFPREALCSECVHEGVVSGEITEQYSFLDKHGGWHGEWPWRAVTKQVLKQRREEFERSAGRLDVEAGRPPRVLRASV